MAQHEVQQRASQRPDVRLEGVVAPLPRVHNLRRKEARAAAEKAEVLSFRNELAEAEVADLHAEPLAPPGLHADVLWLDVQVHDALVVNGAEGAGALAKHLEHVRGAQQVAAAPADMLVDVGEEVDAAELHHQREELRPVQRLVEVDDAGHVAQTLDRGDLLLQGRHGLHTQRAIFVDLLDGHHAPAKTRTALGDGLARDASRELALPQRVVERVASALLVVLHDVGPALGQAEGAHLRRVLPDRLPQAVQGIAGVSLGRSSPFLCFGDFDLSGFLLCCRLLDGTLQSFHPSLQGLDERGLLPQLLLLPFQQGFVPTVLFVELLQGLAQLGVPVTLEGASSGVLRSGLLGRGGLADASSLTGSGDLLTPLARGCRFTPDGRRVKSLRAFPPLELRLRGDLDGILPASLSGCSSAGVGAARLRSASLKRKCVSACSYGAFFYAGVATLSAAGPPVRRVLNKYRPPIEDSDTLPSCRGRDPGHSTACQRRRNAARKEAPDALRYPVQHSQYIPGMGGAP
eukprot:scaffold7897_cov248-Pinguiococcus_pyrenoidosus.AAC.10